MTETHLMNPIVGRLWVEALRSGRFKQGVGALSQDGTHCCLGVLCELAVDAGVVKRFTESQRSEGTAVVFGASEETGLRSYLPAPVIEWAGLSDSNPEIAYGREGRQLSDLNDGIEGDDGRDQLTHAQIADLIEAQLVGEA